MINLKICYGKSVANFWLTLLCICHATLSNTLHLKWLMKWEVDDHRAAFFFFVGFYLQGRCKTMKQIAFSFFSNVFFLSQCSALIKQERFNFGLEEVLFLVKQISRQLTTLYLLLLYWSVFLLIVFSSSFFFTKTLPNTRPKRRSR